jgi:hypothetical protein
MPFILRLNAINVAPDLLMAAGLAVAEMATEDRRDLTSRSLEIFKVLESNDVSPNGGLLSAISFRLEALSQLKFRNHKELGGWSTPGDETGEVFMSEDLYRTAALEPMLSEGKRAAFEPVNFFKRLLSISKVQGRG